MKKVLLVDQIGHKTYEYDYAAAKNYSKEYDVTCYMSDNTPRDLDTTGFHVKYGFHDVFTGTKIQKGIKYIRALLEMKKYIEEEHFDIITLQWYELALIQKFMLRSIKRKCIPSPKIVMTVHGIIPKELGRFRHFELQLLYNEADAILLHSEPGVKYFNSCYHTNCKKYNITSAFRDENDYRPLDKVECRKKLGIPIDKTVILSFGTVRDDKTIDLLYKAFPEIHKENTNIFLLSAGTLNVSNKHEYIELADKCRQTGAAKIDFIYVSKEMEPIYYSAADILVLPYSYISQSGVAYCGLLYRLPMVASNIERLDLMAKNGINADVFQKGDYEDLAKKILGLASDKKKMYQYSLGSEKIREKDFSIKNRVRATEEAYKEIFSENIKEA